MNTPLRIEDSQDENPKCPISSRFPSLTRVTPGASEAELGLLSAGAPEPAHVRSSRKAFFIKIFR